MKCLILAAGYATRLYPLTENFPKPLLKVGEKTILDWLVDDIDSAGLVDEFVVISNHKYAPHFEAWAKGKKCNTTVLDDGTTSNETRLGAVRDIQFAIETLNLDDDLLVIAGDNVLDFSLTKFIAYAMEKKTSCVMRYFEPRAERLRKCGVALADENDLILSLEEKPAEPKSNWCTPPFYFYTREDAKRVKTGIELGCGVDAPGSYVAWLCTQTRVHSMQMPGNRYDIGNLESYRQVQETYRGIVTTDAQEMRTIMEKFAASGWDLIAAPAQKWLDAKFDNAALIAAFEEADRQCGSCGCDFDPLYKRALELLKD